MNTENRYKTVIMSMRAAKPELLGSTGRIVVLGTVGNCSLLFNYKEVVKNMTFGSTRVR